MSRISIEVTPEQHNAVKAMALLEGLNIKEFVIKQVFKDIPQGKKPNARLRAAIRESIKNGPKLKKYKTAKDLFNEYR